MPKTSKVLCHVSQSHLIKSQGSTCVWISDEILAHTFNSFTRCHKRYGSNVPGPLEAQRRAARRKNTSVAYTSPYNAGYQPFEAFGAKPKDGWWDKQLLQAKDFTLSSSWLWSLVSPQRAPSYDLPRHDLHVLSNEDERVQVKNVGTGEGDILERLKQIHTHSDLMTLLRNTSINLPQHPQLTQIILEHILQHDWQLDQLEEFLLEPQTNPAGSISFFYLLQNSNRYPTVVKQLMQRKVFIRAAVLGLVDVEDLKKILMLVPVLELDSNSSGHPFAWASFSVDLLSALDCSKVIHLRDLGQSFIIEWSKLIKSREFQPAKAQLLWTVYRFLGHSGRKALRKVVINSIQTIDHTCLNHMPALARFVLSQPHGHLRDILLPVTQYLMSEAAGKHIVLKDDRDHDEDAAAYRQALTSLILEYQNQMQDITDNTAQDNQDLRGEISMLVNHTNECDPRIALSSLSRPPFGLEKWYIFLRILNTRASISFRLSPGFFRAYPNNTEIGLEEQQLFVVQLWISMALFDHCRENLEELTKRKISALFARLLSHCTGTGSEDKLVSFIRIARPLLLPSKHQLLGYLSFVCKELSFSGQTYAMLTKKVDDLDRGQVVNVSKTRYYNSTRVSSPALLSEVAESMNEDMRNFEITCRSVIRETEKGPVLVSRLLTHNHELKFALRQAAILSFSSPLHWDNEDAARKTALGNYSFNQVVGMINNFAVECANKDHMSPRNRFRKVFWYYKFLHRCRAPIKPVLLDALWIAGVERYNGSSKTEVLSWLYKISVAYLGERAAKTYLQRAVLRDRTLQRVAASIARREGKQQTHEGTEQIIRPLELIQVDSEEEQWCEDLAVESSILHFEGTNDAERSHHSSAFSKSDSSMHNLSQHHLWESKGFSQLRVEKTANKKHVLQQTDVLHQADQPLQQTEKAEEIIGEILTSKPSIRQHDTTSKHARDRIFEPTAVLKPAIAASATIPSEFNQNPDIAEFEVSVHFGNNLDVDARAAGQVSQQIHDGSVAAQYGRGESMTSEPDEEQISDLPGGTTMNNWLNTQYTTLEARMISARKGKIKKPGRRRSKLLTWT